MPASIAPPVTINEGFSMTPKNGYSRRDFLKVIGASSGVALASCGKELPEKLIPYVIQPDDTIPGVATWYSGSCFECSAGCGVRVRTREGRALKSEGNPDHPINAGGLCSRGQSAVQTLYDPDRVREPLKRDANGAFKPIPWKDAVQMIADAIAAIGKEGKKDAVLLTNPVSGSVTSLISEFAAKAPRLRHVQYELFSSETTDRAAEICFGSGVTTEYDFSKAEAIVGVGAGYLDTWGSPVEHARGWAAKRKPDATGSMSFVAHIEPRLSLTAANSDFWLMNKPGTEAAIMKALLKAVLDRSKASGNGDRAVAEGLVRGADLATLLADSGVSPEKVTLVAERLVNAKSSLVIAGGPTVGTSDELQCAVLANVLNAVLGNIGETVFLEPKSATEKISYREMSALIKDMGAEKKVGLLLISGVNPAFTLPALAGFEKAVGNVGLVVALATNLDETARLANLVLPLSTSFESWMDAEPRPGVHNLNQPAMQPLYPSLSLGDTLIAVASKLDISFGDTKSFYEYIRGQWKRRTGEGGFEDRWLSYVQSGGEWSRPFGGRETRHLNGSIEQFIKGRKEAAPQNGLVLLAFPTVRGGDGSSSNRPWMQEVPDPLTSVVWGSWLEVHPDTARAHGLRSGSVVQVVTANGSLEAPLYENKFIHPNAVAIPIGQGHESLGRYADSVGSNPLKIVSVSDEPQISFTASGVTLRPATSEEELVRAQTQDSQVGRDILRSVSAGEVKHKIQKANGKLPIINGSEERAEHGHGAEHGEEKGHHEVGQMYKQMEPPLYRWGMSIDLASCTGCGACVVGCYAENNVPVVGKAIVAQGREMSWLRIDRYFDGPQEQPVTGFQPMLCQHCGNAPCEPVCPVYATYHNDEGLNAMVYNRCVGTRYCGNNCSYKVRRFNWFHYTNPEPLTWQLNPDVTVREVGVMEKCSFCIQRIKEAQNKAKNIGAVVQDGDIQPACAQSCPTKAITFGNLLDKESQVSKMSENGRAYRALDEELNTQPAISYLVRVRNDSEKVEA